jgi:hypothetical protein
MFLQVGKNFLHVMLGDPLSDRPLERFANSWRINAKAGQVPRAMAHRYGKRYLRSGDKACTTPSTQVVRSRTVSRTGLPSAIPGSFNTTMNLNPSFGFASSSGAPIYSQNPGCNGKPLSAGIKKMFMFSNIFTASVLKLEAM